MVGNNGYNSSEYTHSFNGTSAACPIVAGIAGLLLSEYESLSRTELESAIKRGCEKVGGYDYNLILPDGTWCAETGHGRVNALNALQEAQATGFEESLSQQHLIRTMSNQYEIVFRNPVSWEMFDITGRLVTSGQNSQTVIVPFNSTSSGLYLLTATDGLKANRIKLLMP